MRIPVSIGLTVLFSLLISSLNPVWAAFNPGTAQRLLGADSVAYDHFGISVSVAGDIAVIGAYGDGDRGRYTGAAYVFIRVGLKWEQQAKLIATDGVAGDHFGRSVAVDGETIVIGATGFNDRNAVYVFVRSGTLWNLQAKLMAADAPTYSSFSCSVSLHADTVLVGDQDREAAYIFTRSGTVWSQQAKITAFDDTLYSSFGCSVSLNNDTALIGASQASDNEGQSSGAAYIFTRSGTTWSQQAKLTGMEDPHTIYANFGLSVSLYGDTALVGSPNDGSSIDSSYRAGSAYIFTRSGTIWSMQAKLLAEDREDNDSFGYPVAINCDSALIGAMGDDDRGSESGAAYLFTHDGSAWSQQKKISDSVSYGSFAQSLSLDSETALIGAYFDIDSTGAAYIYRNGTAAPWRMLLLKKKMEIDR